jgi:3-hydroxyisobutyrate dehydrogenase
MNIALLGTGLMGAPAALRLQQQGHDVTAWNRTAEKAEAALQGKVPVTADLTTAINAADTLLLFLSDAEAISSVLFSVPARLLAGKTIIQMGTIAPDQSRALQTRLNALQASYLEAPVLGSIPEARAGTLLLMVGATPQQFEQYLPLLSALGESPRLMGPVGKAAAVKLAMNQLIAGLTASFSLSLNFVLAEGAEVSQFMEILRESALYAPTFDKKLGKMLEGSYDNPNFPLKHLDKDVKLFLQAAATHHLNTAMLNGVAAIIEDGLAQGHGNDDYSALRESI